MNSFRADASTTTGQTNLPDCAYIKLNMPNEVCDTGNHYDPTLSRWTPPAGPIIIQGQVWVGDVSQGSGGYTDFVAKVYKNGAGITTGIGTQSGFPGWPVAPICCVDNANGTDYYEVYIFTTSPGSVARSDYNPAHTWWGGISA